jgi:hypothetical protein
MGKTRSLALLLGLSAAISIGAQPVFAQSEESNEPGVQDSPGSDGVQNPAPGREPRAEETPEERAAKLARRRERLEAGAKRLRDRAAELRKKAANGESPPEPPANSKRPRRSFEEQATRLEEQANKMDERVKNLDDPATSERSQLSARQRRHQVRRIQLNKRWGTVLHNPEAITELKLHAERSAKLRRIRTLALQKGKDDPAAARAAALMAKEDVRYERRMTQLQAAAAAAAPAAPAAPASTQNAGEESK